MTSFLLIDRIDTLIFMDLLRWHKYNKECSHVNDYELTPFLVDDKTAPVILICPGGGYRMVASFIEGIPVAEYYQKHGVNAFVLRYRVKEKAKYPSPVEDIARALNEIKDQYHLSLSNYALCGFSAGGHMSALFGTKEYGYIKYNLPKPNMLVLIYPVISLEKEITHKGTRKWFAKEDDNLIEIGNIYHHIDKDYPSTFIIRGDNDRSVPYINSDLLIDELKKNNINCLYYQYKKFPHGVGLGQNTPGKDWPENSIKFWLNRQ